MNESQNQLSKRFSQLIAKPNRHRQYFEKAVKNLEMVRQEEQTEQLLKYMMIHHSPLVSVLN